MTLERQTIAIPAGLKVMIGMPVGRPLPMRTVAALCATVKTATERGVNLALSMVQGTLPWARDDVLDEFLKSDCERLFWIDSDMAWTPDDFARMVALSTRVDVLCATYPAKLDGDVTFYVNWEPGQPAGAYGLLPVNGAGLGFAIMSRRAVEAVAASKPTVLDEATGRRLKSVFRFDTLDGKRQGEDMAFFADIAAAGYQVWLDPQVRLGHIGEKQWEGAVIDAFAAESAAA